MARDPPPQGGLQLSVKGCRLLRQLGEDHQRAVTAVRRLAAADAPGSLDAATARFLKTWREEIIPHNRKEEEVLLPDLAQKISEGDAVIILTLTDHIVLRRIVRALERSPDARRRDLVTELVQRLEEHVKFEEQTLFPAMEQALGRARLAELESELARRRDDFEIRPRSVSSEASRGEAGGTLLSDS